jgi:hypothetical protein
MEASAPSLDLVRHGGGLMERNLATFPGWQLGPQKARRRIERRDFLGVIARVDRAPLGEIELDVLTWLSARWYEQGRVETGRVAFTLYELGQALYGSGKRLGGRNNDIIREALENLHAVVITLSGVNVLTGEFERTFQSKVHILRTLVVNEQLQLLDQGEGWDPAAVGALRGATIEVQLEDWLVAQLAGEAAVQLDWATQRRLTGLAKRLWVYLAAEAPRFEPLPDGRAEFVAPLSRDVYGALGIECQRDRDNRAALVRAARRVLAEDPRYVEIAVERVDRRSLWHLRVVWAP